MFNPEYVEHVKKNIPLLNPVIMNGLSQEEAKHSLAHVDSIFKEMAKTFPPYLKYDGSERATPEEEYFIATQYKSSSRKYDIARTDSYYCKYKFTLVTPEGEKQVVRYLALPIIGEANSIHINDTKYVYSPVLADRVISVTAKSVFLKLVRAKLTFFKHQTYFLENGQRTLVHTIHAMAYNHKDPSQFSSSKISMKTCLVHYLMCKYGLTKMFEKYANVTPVVKLKRNINPDDYPVEDWVICQTASFSKPSSLKTNYYRPTELVIMFPREKYTPMAQKLACGVFYVADHFPDEERINEETIDETITWQVMLGEAIWATGIHVGRLTEEIKRHMSSLEEYIDDLVKIKLAKDKIFVDDLFDLYALIIDKFLIWHLEKAEDTNNLYNKELIVLDYLLEDIQHQIVKFYFKVTEAAKNGKVMTLKELEDILSKEIKLNTVFALKKAEHGEAFIAESSGDNKIFKITQVITQQEKTNKLVSKRSEIVSNDDPSLKSHVSVAYVGAYSAISKADPTGQNRINGYVLISGNSNLDEAGFRGRFIERNPKLDPVLDLTDAMIKGKI